MKHIKLYEDFLNESVLNEGSIAKKKFPADEFEAGEDTFEWLMGVLDRLEDIEISDSDEEVIREADPEEVASFVSGLLKNHTIDVKRSGRQFEITVKKQKVHEDFLNEANVTALKVSGLTPAGLEDAGVEVPNVNINLNPLRKLMAEAEAAVKEMTEMRILIKRKPEMAEEGAKLQKELEDLLEKFKKESEKTYEQYVKALESIKFPTEAAAKLWTTDQPREWNSFDQRDRWQEDFIDLDGKTMLDLPNHETGWVYQYVEGNAKKAWKIRTELPWREILMDKAEGVKKFSVIDKKFLLDQLSHGYKANSF